MSDVEKEEISLNNASWVNYLPQEQRMEAINLVNITLRDVLQEALYKVAYQEGMLDESLTSERRRLTVAGLWGFQGERLFELQETLNHVFDYMKKGWVSRIGDMYSENMRKELRHTAYALDLFWDCDEEKAVRWWKLAWELHLAVIKQNKNEDDYDEDDYYFDQDPDHLCECFGNAYKDGKGVKADYETALSWYRKIEVPTTEIAFVIKCLEAWQYESKGDFNKAYDIYDNLEKHGVYRNEQLPKKYRKHILKKLEELSSKISLNNN